MRLSKIKLAGFKSFVDATTLPFPSNRVSVVGPNGCGKSNVIDAVRWVMGESSAKHLRGASMTDVIFNGSSTRQPVETAYVELVFEEVNLPQHPPNSEIAVKRQINRTGQSTYFMNGVKCRRKDITDLFLGTGLGARSYAIIEQGMISRLIEAKPQELRVFFEEAAGISKYKERRRETENNMKHTRDNMARLDEVRHELQRQLNKLEKQVKAAEKFKELKTSEKLLKAQLQALRWTSLDQAIHEQQQLIDNNAEQLANDLNALQQLEGTNTEQRAQQEHAQADLTRYQEQFYQLDTQIQQLEQQIQHHHERHQQLLWDIEQLNEDIANNAQHSADDEIQLAEYKQQHDELAIQVEALREADEQVHEHLSQTETLLQDWHISWDEFNLRAAEPTQRAQVIRSEIQHLEQQLQQNQQRLMKAEEAHRGIDLQTIEAEVAQLDIAYTAIQAECEEAETGAQQLQINVSQLRDETQQLASRLHEAHSKANQYGGRLASLETLQESALGKSNADMGAWLHAHGLHDTPRLAEQIQVNEGWERAVEIVLGTQLNALCIEDLNQLQHTLNQPPTGQLSVIEMQQQATNIAESVLAQHSTLLADKLTAPIALHDLLVGVWVADSLEQAYQLRPYLQAHESLITPEGIQLGRYWLHSQQGDNEQAGILAREQEIKTLAEKLTRVDNSVVELTQLLEQKRSDLHLNESEYTQAQQQLKQLNQQRAELHSQQGAKHTRLEHLREQQQRFAEEISELQQQLEESGIAEEQAHEMLHEALAAMEVLADERERLAAQRDQLQLSQEQARQAAQQARTQLHQTEVQLHTAQTEKKRTQQSLERLQAQLAQQQDKRHELSEQLEEQLAPVSEMEMQLGIASEEKAVTEEHLQQCKQTVEQLSLALTDYDQQRHILEERSNQLRTVLEQARMDSQANLVRRQTIEEQLEAEEQSPITLLAELPEYADEPSWQSQIEAVTRKVEKLGTVNLAALAEYEEQQARKQELDVQKEDLDKALSLLDNAIKTIDRETRTRFRQTLETVNGHLQSMFPRLFGGGQASVELTDDDILTAGVTIMAHPPGKRNSTIHLLSGGEKALTAIALVFAIFELNPAPFCMLDEVDAPLDDTNTARFSQLVKAMSERVQFIFITHNKITMEIADQLLGVTMQEAGVSRPVAVDIDMAVSMVTE